MKYSKLIIFGLLFAFNTVKASNTLFTNDLTNNWNDTNSSMITDVLSKQETPVQNKQCLKCVKLNNNSVSFDDFLELKDTSEYLINIGDKIEGNSIENIANLPKNTQKIKTFHEKNLQSQELSSNLRNSQDSENKAKDNDKIIKKKTYKIFSNILRRNKKKLKNNAKQNINNNHIQIEQDKSNDIHKGNKIKIDSTNILSKNAELILSINQNKDNNMMKHNQQFKRINDYFNENHVTKNKHVRLQNAHKIYTSDKLKNLQRILMILMCINNNKQKNNLSKISATDCAELNYEESDTFNFLEMDNKFTQSFGGNINKNERFKEKNIYTLKNNIASILRLNQIPSKDDKIFITKDNLKILQENGINIDQVIKLFYTFPEHFMLLNNNIVKEIKEIIKDNINVNESNIIKDEVTGLIDREVAHDVSENAIINLLSSMYENVYNMKEDKKSDTFNSPETTEEFNETDIYILKEGIASILRLNQRPSKDDKIFITEDNLKILQKKGN